MILQPAQALWPCKDMCRGKNAHCIVGIPDEEAITAIREVVKGRIQQALAAAQQNLHIRSESGRTSIGVPAVDGVLPVEAGEVAAGFFD